MASTGDTKATENGPGTISDALTAFEARATKLPSGPAPDPNAAVAYALGWAVGDALTCTKYQVFKHLTKVPGLDAPSDQWNLLVNQIISRCGHLDNHLKSTQADFDLSAQLKICATLPLGSPPGDIKTAVGAKNTTAMELNTGILRVLWSVSPPLAKSYQLGHEMEQSARHLPPSHPPRSAFQSKLMTQKSIGYSRHLRRSFLPTPRMPPTIRSAYGPRR